MNIVTLGIGQFGALKDKTISVSSGLNLIVGENESGKSTVSSFIKYILYGFEKGEREKRENYLSLTSSGYLTVKSDEGKTYRIERRDLPGAKSKVSVFSEDGSVFTDWQESGTSPGEYFLGIPEKMYSRSIYISQEYGAAQDEKSAESVSNLLLSGDEAINLHKAGITLERARKELRVKRGRGGKITDCEDRIAALKERFSEEMRLKESIADTELLIREKVKEKAALTERLKSAEAAEKYKKISKAGEILKRKEAVEKSLKAADKRKNEIIRKYTANGFLPKNDYTELLKRLSLEFSNASANLEFQRKNREKAEERRLSEVPEGYDKYVKAGSKAAICANYAELSRFSGRFRIGMIVTALITFASLSALILGRSGVVGAKNYPLPFLIISVVSFATVTFFGLFWRKKLKEYEKIVGVPEGSDVYSFCRACDDYEKAIERDRAFYEENIVTAENRVKYREKAIEKLLSRWDKSSTDEAFGTYANYLSEQAELEKESACLTSENEVLGAYLSAYTEEELLLAANPEFASGGEIETTESAEFIKQKLDGVSAQLQRLEVEKAEKTGEKRGDAEEIAIETEKEKKELQRLNTVYEAIVLAAETLEEAEGGVRNTVSPYLGKVSGEYFNKLTAGKYEGLLLSDGMELSFRSPSGEQTLDSSYLSGGSADLAWYCLRLALHKKLSEEKKLPLILDESFVYLDDVRLARVLEMLKNMAKEGTQIFIFSASSREKNLLCGENIFTLN